MHRSVRNLLACSLFLLAACSSDNFTWSFVSDPGGDGFGGTGGTGGGSGGGAVIVIRGSSGSSPAGSADRTLAFRNFLAETTDGIEPVDVHLPPGSELALVVRTTAGRLELLSPLLPDRRIEVPSAGLSWLPDGPLLAEIALPDAGAVTPEAAPGAGRLVIAAFGTLLALEHAGGLLVWGDPSRAGPDGALRFAAGSRLTFRDEVLYAVTPDQRLERLFQMPPVDPSRQLRRPAAGQLELRGPDDRPLARVPEANTTVYAGDRPLFVAADFPGGLPGGSGRPVALRVATSNRYLLRIDG